MNHPLRVLVSFCLLVVVSFSWCASGEADSNASLRSAYLGQSAWTDDLSSSAIKDQLQEHFAEVVKQLETKQTASLLQSLRRAEASSSQTWTKSQRRATLNYLATRRQLQIERLKVYSERGLFPLNEGQSTGAVPIFVDRHQTHCAVGYLMHSDGHDSGVQSIVDANNLVYVNEAREGSLLDWVWTSGLTQEEAAMIQPGYPVGLDATFEDLFPDGATLQKNGFVLSDVSVRGYRFFATDVPASFEDSPEAIQAILSEGITLLKTNNVVGASFRFARGVLFGSGSGNGGIPLGEGPAGSPANLTDWLYVGHSDGLFNGMVGSANASGDTGIVEIEYSLSVEPGHRLTEFALTSSAGNPDTGPINEIAGVQSAILLLSDVFGGATGDLLGSLELFTTGAGGDVDVPLIGSESLVLGTDSISVRSYGLVVGGNGDSFRSSFHSLFHELDVTEFILGDINQDGAVNLLDVAPFIDLIIAGEFQSEADVNGDGVVDLLDVAPFVDLFG